MNARIHIGACALLLAGAAAAADTAIPLPLSGPAYRLAQQAYRSYARRDYADAVAQAREALRLRPDVASLRQLLDTALAARHAASRAPAQDAAGSASLAASLAYRAYDAGDFEAAAAHARDAVALAPRSRSYRLLLANALAGARQPEQAAAALDAALAVLPDSDGALAARRREIGLLLAAAPMARMYAALARDDLDKAADAVRQAVQQAPSVSAYGLLLVQVLARAGHWEQAAHAADETLARAGNDSALLAMRGFLRQHAADSAAAQADFARALQQPGLARADARNIALLAADAALDAALPRRALDLLAPFAGDGAPVDLRLAAARLDLARLAAGGRPRAARALAIPELACHTSPHGQSCAIAPGEAARDPGYEAASEGYAALAARQYGLAAERAREALVAQPGRREWRLLLLSALDGASQYPEAEALASELLAEGGTDAALLVRRAALRQHLGREEDARADLAAAERLHTLAPAAQVAVLAQLQRRPEAARLLQAALRGGELASVPDLDLAYLAVSAGEDALALSRFDSADAAGVLPPGALRDAGFAALRTGRDDAARGYFERAIDAADAGQLELDAAQRFAARRAVAELSRTWGVFAGASYRGAGPLGGAAGGAANPRDNALQAGAEAYYRPYSSNGKQLDLFVRAYQTLRAGPTDASGPATLQGAAGVRIKPFAGSNLFFSASRLAGGGTAARTDWLAQVSYFYGRGTDLRPAARGWATLQFTADAGHYFTHREDYANFCAQLGRSVVPAASHPGLLLVPHLVLAHDYNSAYTRRNATGLGAGITLRWWFHEDRHAAPRSFVDVSVEYRARVTGDERARGLFVTASLSY